MTTADEERAGVIAEATEWIGTPYIPNGRIKGRQGGCDCLTLIAGVYENADIVPHMEIPHYPRDWHWHQEDELYLLGKDATPGVLHHCVEVAGPPERRPLPADLIMWKFGHCFSHAAIVVEWPLVLHAYSERPVGHDDVERTSVLRTIHEDIRFRGQPRPRKFFTLKRWA